MFVSYLHHALHISGPAGGSRGQDMTSDQPDLELMCNLVALLLGQKTQGIFMSGLHFLRV